IGLERANVQTTFKRYTQYGAPFNLLKAFQSLYEQDRSFTEATINWIKKVKLLMMIVWK
ncbi:unnamed protein product, partial [Didymodactylos carnosus]